MVYNLASILALGEPDFQNGLKACTYMMPEFGTYPLFAFSMDYCVYVQKNALCRAPKGIEFCTTVMISDQYIFELGYSKINLVHYEFFSTNSSYRIWAEIS